MRDTRKQGRVVVVTGGATGIGRGLAAKFASHGDHVVILDIDPIQAAETARLVADTNGSVLSLECDVAQRSDVAAACRRVAAETGRIDVLVNNAGLHLDRYQLPFSELSENEIQKIFNVNVHGVINCTLEATELMAAAGGGSIINITSIAALSASNPYGVTKLAVRGLTNAFATELASRHIRVNGVSPGFIETEQSSVRFSREAAAEFAAHNQLIPRQGMPDDIFAAVSYLCSEAASFVTGQTIGVDGGYRLGS